MSTSSQGTGLRRPSTASVPAANSRIALNMPQLQRTKCAFCSCVPVVRSHIVPEFAYSPSYDETHTLVALDPLNPEKQWRRQVGVREPLLCQKCDGELNDRYESRFKKLWFDERPLSVLESCDYAELRIPEPERFKLFHLSVLLRADLASRQQWRSVVLSPRHRARLFEMVRSLDAGEPYEFPIVCFAVRRSADDPSIWWDLVGDPLVADLYGVRQFQFTFGGCTWMYFDSLHPVPEIQEVAFRPDGTLRVRKKDWKAFEYYRDHQRLE